MSLCALYPVGKAFARPFPSGRILCVRKGQSECVDRFLSFLDPFKKKMFFFKFIHSFFPVSPNLSS